MKSVSRRSLLFAGALSAMALVGCESNDGNTEPEPASSVDDGPEEGEAAQDEQNDSESTQASVGEAIGVETEYGDVSIIVEGFASDTGINDQYAQYLGEGMVVGMLLAMVENVSYEWHESSVDLGDYMRVEDQDGVSINDFGLSPSFNEYKGYPGRYFECQIGEKKRVAMCFEMPVTTQSVTAVFGDVRVPIEIERS